MVFFIDRLECDKCGLIQLYNRDRNSEPRMSCPTCKSKSIYLKVEMGYEIKDIQPVDRLNGHTYN